MEFHQISPSDAVLQALDGFEDRTIFQSPQWLKFIESTQMATPVLAELRDGQSIVGYFSGLTIKRFGFRILGSPFPGWTTPYIGFNLHDDVPRWKALEALERLAFKDLKCQHFEVSDRRFTQDDVVHASAMGYEVGSYDSYETDLSVSEDELFMNMKGACRRCIRKAEKSGLRIEEAHDASFAGEYYRQLEGVFSRQSLVPTYDLRRVEQLITNLLPTGNLLLLRAMEPGGDCIATGIYPGANEVAQFWGNASVRSAQHYRPNEALHWHAMKYWKERGIQAFDWGGGGEYKEKYGVVPLSVPWLRKSRNQLILVGRDAAKRAAKLKQKLMGRIRSSPKNPVR